MLKELLERELDSSPPGGVGVGKLLNFNTLISLIGHNDKVIRTVVKRANTLAELLSLLKRILIIRM